MNHDSENIRDLVEKLEDMLTLLDKNGFSLPAIKVEEAIIALRKMELLDESTDPDSGRTET